ncbi:MAG TPA: hypothetical protein DC057_16235 [Spirochaetia bacterium]|nr:hypothetical protein [Spirochaetia bacterium]
MRKNYYNQDPRWITGKFGKCKKCGISLTGKKTLYYPIGKSVFCEKCGESEYNAFSASVQDENFYNSQYSSY